MNDAEYIAAIAEFYKDGPSPEFRAHYERLMHISAAIAAAPAQAEAPAHAARAAQAEPEDLSVAYFMGLHAGNETLHFENEQLRAGYDAARLEIASLQAQLEAVGAGGVSPLMGASPAHDDSLTVAYLAGSHDAKRAALASQSHPVGAVPQWVPAGERLPEPGKPVLLDIGKKHPIRAMWAPAKTLEASLDADPVGDYDEAADIYYCPEGWYEWNQHEDTHWAVSETPVAWVYLPAPYSADAAPQPPAQALDALKQVCAIAVSAAKTNSRDIADWRDKIGNSDPRLPTRSAAVTRACRQDRQQ